MKDVILGDGPDTVDASGALFKDNQDDDAQKMFWKDSCYTNKLNLVPM